MAFTKLENSDFNKKGASSLPNQPKIGATALKAKFDEPAKNVVAPAYNRLIDELEAETGAASLGAVGGTVQEILTGLESSVSTAIINVAEVVSEISAMSVRVEEVELMAHEHDNKSLLDSYTQSDSDLGTAVAYAHYHGNSETLDKLSDSDDGRLAYNGTTVGDMEKWQYDTNGDGVVNAAETLYDSQTYDRLQATVAELNNLQGSTGNIQFQLDDKIGRYDTATGNPIYINDDIYFEEGANFVNGAYIVGNLFASGDMESFGNLTVAGDITANGVQINADVSTDASGLCPMLPSSTSGKYLDDTGNWSVPSGASPDVAYTWHLAYDFRNNKNYVYGDYVVHYDSVRGDYVLYRFVADHAAGAWDDNDVVEVVVLDEVERKIEDVIANDFNPSTSYSVGDYATYHGSLCKFKSSHSGTWSDNDVDYVTVGYELGKKADISTVPVNCYEVSDTEVSTVSSNDKFPFYQYGGGKRKIKWDNIRSDLKSYFDLYYTDKYYIIDTKTTASGVDTFTVNNADITGNETIDPFADVPCVAPIDASVTSHQIQVKFASSDNVTSCKVYIRG